MRTRRAKSAGIFGGWSRPRRSIVVSKCCSSYAEPRAIRLHPEVRFEHRLGALQGTFVGVEGVSGWFADLMATVDPARVDCDDIRDLGDSLLALGTLRATGRESGVETEFPISIVARYKDGLLVDFIDYGDRDKALEAAGLTG